MLRTIAIIVLGAVIGVVVGYEAYALTRPKAVAILEWVTVPGLGAVDWIVWAIIGAGVAAELSLSRTR